MNKPNQSHDISIEQHAIIYYRNINVDAE